jgi:large subunit ribosomal protein L6
VVKNALAEEIEMSRVGKKPIPIPAGVTVTVEPGNVVRVKGNKGELTERVPATIEVAIEDGVVNVKRASDEKKERAMHGLARALVANMVTGVTQGFSKALEVVGVGYRVQKSGNKLVLNVGYSHPVEVPEENGIKLDVEGTNVIKVSGTSKQVVGQVAADIRSIRPPEPYKGKGIRYAGEFVALKVGKAGMK